MSGIRVKIDIGGMKQKLRALKETLPREVEAQLQKIAERCVDQIENTPQHQRTNQIAKALGRQFRSIFIPVTLRHKRTELWPDPRVIYQARIVRHQRTYRGRKVFYVDEQKVDALFSELLAKASKPSKSAHYTFRLIETSDQRTRLEIIRTGYDANSRKNASVVIAYAKQQLQQANRLALQHSFSAAGLT